MTFSKKVVYSYLGKPNKGERTVILVLIVKGVIFMAVRSKKVEEKILLQVYGKEVDVAYLRERAEDAFVQAGHKKSEIKDVKLYLKHEDMACYYVINENFAGRVSLF